MKNKIKKWKEEVQTALSQEGGIPNERTVEQVLLPHFFMCLGFNPMASDEQKRGCKKEERGKPGSQQIPDYVIFYGERNNERIVLEAKDRFDGNQKQIEKFRGQLANYFDSMRANNDKKIGILTDGRKYYFYSNFHGGSSSNMDEQPFLNFDISSDEDLDEDIVNFLSLLQREKNFPEDEIYEAGKDLDHIRLFGKIFRETIIANDTPKKDKDLDKGLVEFFAKHPICQEAYPDKKGVLERGAKNFDSLQKKLAKVFYQELIRYKYSVNHKKDNTSEEEIIDDSSLPGKEDIQAYYMTASFLSEYGIPFEDIFYKKYGQYFSVYLRDKKEKERILTTICQFKFITKGKTEVRVNFSDDGLEQSKWVSIGSTLNDLYLYKERLASSLKTAQSNLKN